MAEFTMNVWRGLSKPAQIPAADPGREDQVQQLRRWIYGENELTALARFE